MLEQPSEAEMAAFDTMADMHIPSMLDHTNNVMKAMGKATQSASEVWKSDSCKLGWGGLVFMALDCQMAFPDGTKFQFKGRGFGVVVGAGYTWGRMYAHADPATLRGREVEYQFNIGASAVNVNIWDENSGTYLGSFIGGGVSFGAGSGGGSGDFN